MRSLATVAALLAVIGMDVAAAARQTGANDPKSASLTTLRGCVANPANNKRAFTLSDGTGGQEYVLKGLNVRDFLGKRVEITGAPSKLRIVGGLYPNANVAGQPYDPVKAAMAAQTPSGQPSKAVDFQVKSVRAVDGVCPE
jgi:hypothetical protein